MKICPVCNTRYEDSWEVCLNDGSRLASGDGGAPNVTERTRVAVANHYQYLHKEMQSRLLTLLVIQLINILINALPSMVMDPMVGLFTLRGLPIITGLLAVVWTIMLARTVRAIGLEYIKFNQRIIHPNVLIIGQLIISILFGRTFVFGQLATMALPVYVWAKARRFKTTNIDGVAVDLKPKQNGGMYGSFLLIVFMGVLAACVMAISVIIPTLPSKTFTLDDKSAQGRYLAYRADLPADIKEVRDRFRRLVDSGRISEAVELIDPILKSSSDIRAEWPKFLLVTSGNVIVKHLYKQGDLKGAILMRKKSIAASGSTQFIGNEIVELWDLQALYRKLVGETEYLKDLQISSAQLEFDPFLEKISTDYYDELKKGKEVTAYFKADFYSSYYFVRLDFARAATECIKGLESLKKIRAVNSKWGSDFFIHSLQERLVMAYVMQGKYDEAVAVLKNEAPQSDGRRKTVETSINTLQLAAAEGLGPGDLAYPAMDSLSRDMSFYVRDKSFNRLESSDPRDSIYVRALHRN